MIVFAQLVAVMMLGASAGEIAVPWCNTVTLNGVGAVGADRNATGWGAEDVVKKTRRGKGRGVQGFYE
jgi:hypothetical protein